jgi:FAD/FMN-containing dehydrogenase
MTDWAGFAASLDGVPFELDPALVRQKSRDFFWYSPVLKDRLRGLAGDIVVLPRDEADVLTVARRCVAERVPLTVRGAGTGNYGQAVPLRGGVVLDVTGLATIGALTDGVLRVGAGARLIDIEAVTRPLGWELRMFPSTRRTATIGGFVAGGSGGVGSINFGQLRDRGTLLAARVVTLEETPRVLVLRGDEVLRVHHAYGTNGVITELDIAMAPAQPWVDVAVTFTDFMALARFCHALTCADGIAKRLATAIAAPVPQYFRALADRVPPPAHLGLFMIAATGLQPFGELLAEHGGIEVAREREAEVPFYEYTWNHTTLQALKVDKGITYLQTLFGGDDYLDKVAAMLARFGDEVPMHLEFVRLGGRAQAFGLQLVRYRDAARLDEIIRIHEESGCPISNPHTFVLEDGGMKATDPAQLAFKRLVDPFGLANPGKMRGFSDGSDP